MKKTLITVLALVVTLSMLFACGGGGGGGGGGTGSSTVSGVAAAGAPIVGMVYLKDSSSSYKELSSTINANGSFSFNVDGLKPPFILKAQGASEGTNYTLYSFSPAAGIANINPLSHLSIVQANGGGDPTSIYANPILKINLISAVLPNVLSDIQSKLSLLFSYFGASTVNFISDSFTANHKGLDQLFDLVSITIANGTVTITNKATGGTIFTSTLINGTLNGQINTNNFPNRYSILDNWQMKSSGTSNHLYEVAYGNGVFVAVGDLGTILTSPNGTTWQLQASGISNHLYDVTYDNGVFVAVGDLGTILTSPNGTTWQLQVSGITTDIVSVTYGNGTFVALGDSGTILKSTNGRTWSVSRTLPNNYAFNGITYGNGIFVAVNINSTIFTSTNGTTWQSNNLTPGTQLSSVTYGNGTFVAVGPSTILTSTNGTTWQVRVSSQTLGPISDVTYSQGAFIAVGKLGLILISDAYGANWEKWNSSGTSNYLTSITNGKDTFVAVGYSGTILQLGQ